MTRILMWNMYGLRIQITNSPFAQCIKRVDVYLQTRC